MMKKVIIAGLLAGAVSSYGDVIAAWNFKTGTDATVSAGWTTFTVADSATVTTGGLTLTQDASGAAIAKSIIPVTDLSLDPAIQILSSTDFLKGFDLNDALTAIDVQGFTLSGLTVGQEYRLQFAGSVQYKDTPDERNLTMAVDGGAAHSLLGLPPAGIVAPPNYDNVIYYGYSDYAVFTATDGDVALVFGEISSGNKAVSGLIVETIPEPATIGMLGLGALLTLFVRRIKRRA